MKEKRCMSEAGLVGSVGALWRYPVKSMIGERVQTVVVTERGILGDSAYALVDQSTGKLGSVKNPRKWGFLLTCTARFAEPVESDETVPPALITLPGGACLPTNRPETAKILSELPGRKVSIARGGAAQPASRNIGRTSRASCIMMRLPIRLSWKIVSSTAIPYTS
jgi:uncharacterized protein